MELLFILPWLLGLGVYEYFRADSASDDTTDDGSGNDTLASNDDVIVGAGEADDIQGQIGDDFLLGGANADTLRGGRNDDILVGENGADAVYGGQGYDTILGGAGNDDLFGESGRDLLVGGAGDDSIVGGAGNDTISGSSGADTLVGGEDGDLISGIDVSGTLTPLQVNLVQSATAAATKANAILTDAESTYGDAATSDVLTRLSGGLSSSDSDVSDDQLFGGTGADTLMGDLSDTLTGGDGADAFEISKAEAAEIVTITDFNAALDTLTVYVPFGTDVTYSFVDGATLEEGVSVTLASGVVVAKLAGVLAADLPAGLVNWQEV